ASKGYWLPALHQRLQFAGQGRDDADAPHVEGAYPCARNHSMAARSAAYTGTTRNPSSRSALAEETNIFFLPMRTASTVARGSRPRSLPVMVWSHSAKIMATLCGTRMVGEGRPVIADILSSSCFKVRFSPPKMYRSPDRPATRASAWVFATSFTSTRFSPVSMY